MIFVTVGTHEQPFNRLVQYMDQLKEQKKILEEVVIQTGFSNYIPRFCKYETIFSYQEMNKYVEQARIVITHGGPSSFIMALQKGKIPIVVPRQKQFGEHVNDHQLDFARTVAGHYKNILVISDICGLEETILNYENLIKDMTARTESNNESFNKGLEAIINALVKH